MRGKNREEKIRNSQDYSILTENGSLTTDNCFSEEVHCFP